MRRVGAIVLYDGSNFYGYQGQPKVRTVQAVIEDALEKIFKYRVYTHAAGRTDAGVHACGQLVVFDCPNPRMTNEDIKNAMNANLPSDVYVRRVIDLPEEYNPRAQVKKRIYHYYILNTKEPDIFRRKHLWWFPYELDVDSMRKAARFLEGEHDFSAFRKSDHSDKRNPVRTIYRIRILRMRGNIILIRVEGKSFLRRMVRNIVGALVKVGIGDWQPEKVKEVLESRDRSKGASSAPPQGLYLYSVHI